MAQFPEDVYRNAGASDVLPLVMKNLDADKILAVQFLRAGRVRLTFQGSDTCSQVLKDGLDFGDFSVELLPADDRLRTVHLRDLPVEIEEEVVFSFLGGYGEVLSVSHCFFDEYPNVRNGNRVAKVLLDRDIPQFTELMDATAAFGVHVSRLNVLYAESLAIVPQPVHSLVAAGAVTSPAIWPENAHRLGALLFLCRVPITRWTLKKILVPVPPILKFLVLPLLLLFLLLQVLP